MEHTDIAQQPRLPVVFVKDGDVFANSRDVADFFEKEVKHVHEAIRKLVASAPEDLRSKFRPFNINDLSGSGVSHYEMDRDGFTLLAMGFNGAKALKWKLAYVAAFNEMERTLRAQSHLPDFTDPKVMLGAFQHLQEQVAAKDQVISDQGNRLRKLDRIEGARGTMCITDAAKTLGVPRKDLISLMHARRWIYKRTGNKSWVAYEDKRKAGYMDHDDHIYFDSDGHERVATRALVTAKGLVKLAEILEQPLH